MVIRRPEPRAGGPPSRVEAAFRPTVRQAVGHGLYVGGLIGLTLATTGAVLAGVWWGAGEREPEHTGLGLLGIAVVPALLGALAGIALGTRIGTRADDRGIHRVPAVPYPTAPGSPVVRSKAAWSTIVDIREERRHNRTIVAIYLDSGAVLALRAPYDGRLLAHDPAYERKVFTLLNLWETHRNWRSRP
jgi:hypothetical protein